MERIRPGFLSWLNMESFFDGYITSRTYWVDKFIPLIKQPCILESIRPFFFSGSPGGGVPVITWVKITPRLVGVISSQLPIDRAYYKSIDN